MPETTTYTPEITNQAEISQALDVAIKEVADLTFDNDFLAFALSRRVDMNDQITYWEAVAEFEARTIPKETGLSPLEREAKTIIAFLPNLLTHTYQLESKAGLSEKEIGDAKQVAATYNSLLQHFVSEYPQASKQLEISLLQATLEIMGDSTRGLTDHAQFEIPSRLKGAKYEIGFKKICDRLGLKYRSATVREDRKGRDVVLQMDGYELGVDVKASLDQVDAKNKGSNGTPVAVKPNGDFIVFPMLREVDFQGTFSPSDEALDTVAAPLGALLQRAIYK